MILATSPALMGNVFSSRLFFIVAVEDFYMDSTSLPWKVNDEGQINN